MELDSLNGCGGAYEFEMERTLVLKEALECMVQVKHTCAFELSIDEKPLLGGNATDGWARADAQCALKIDAGKHLVRVCLKRNMPGGMIQLDYIKDGELLALEAINPLKGLK